MTNILVTGAAGHLGRRIVELLLDGKPGHIIAATRDTAKLADFAARGAETRRADFDDAASLDAAFAGVDRLLIISTDALGEDGKRLKQHLVAIEAAKRAGVKHIVYTSMPNPDNSHVTFAPDHLGSENAVKASGIPYTILRNAWYMENLAMALPPALASGHWYTSSGDGKNGYIAREDCARSAAAVLANPPVNQTFTLTGPEAVTTAEIAALASEVFAKPLTVINVTDEQLAGGMKAAGVPEFLIPMLVSFDTTTRAGEFDVRTGDVEQLTGRKPQNLGDYLTANKALFG